MLNKSETPTHPVQSWQMTRSGPSYENRMLLVTSLIVGLLMLDRQSIGYIAPYLVSAFSLTNTQLGALYSAQALAVALAGYAAGALADRTGWRKQILVTSLVIVGFCLVIAGMAHTFFLLLFARFALGNAQGPVATMVQATVSTQSSSHRRGLNMGLQTLAMFLIGAMLGPILLTHLADRWGWPSAFFFTAGPALVLAGIAALTLRRSRAAATEPAHADAAAAKTASSSYNVWLCVAMSMLFMGWLVVHNIFLPLFLVQERGMAPTDMGLVMGALGAAACLGGFGYPFLSDRIGRRPTMIMAMAAATIVPLSVLFFHGPPAILTAILFCGWLSSGVLPIYSVVIPGESVSPARVATTIALIMGSGELVGGVAGPLLAGWIADNFGLVMPFVITAASSLICCALAMALRETHRREQPT